MSRLINDGNFSRICMEIFHAYSTKISFNNLIKHLIISFNLFHWKRLNSYFEREVYNSGLTFINTSSEVGNILILRTDFMIRVEAECHQLGDCLIITDWSEDAERINRSWLNNLIIKPKFIIFWVILELNSMINIVVYCNLLDKTLKPEWFD